MSAATERNYQGWTEVTFVPNSSGVYEHPHAAHPVAGCECEHCYESKNGAIVWCVVAVLFAATWFLIGGLALWGFIQW